jgi:hypothetical protein
LSFDDVELDNETRTFTFKRDDIVIKSIKIPYPKYMGVWVEGEYEEGMLATFGGSIWNAQSDTKSKPGTDGTWLLCVKKGRDGRDAK